MPVSILIGDVFDRLAELPADSIDCCVTSPPYWGLRDYGVAGQIGLEPTLAEHLNVMVRVFDAVRRVLKPEGTLWLNYGDCYATKPNGRSAADTKAAGNDDRTFRDKPFSTIGGSLKPKDLCMIPNRLAIALQDAGWWVRSEIVWGKPNPMPDSSGRYRPSTAHEKVFLLTKSAKSHYDALAVKMPASPDTKPKVARHLLGSKGPALTGAKSNENAHGSRSNASFEQSISYGVVDQRYLRNWEPDLSPIVPPEVWSIATAPFSEAHFATFPPALVAPCLLAGCPVGGTVLDPFGGAGTTGLVADRMQRSAVLIELNPEYAAIAERRLTADRGGLLSLIDEQPALSLAEDAAA